MTTIHELKPGMTFYIRYPLRREYYLLVETPNGAQYVLNLRTRTLTQPSLFKGYDCSPVTLNLTPNITEGV